MTTALARRSLQDFISNPRAAAIALTGPWGSGKTWLWNDVVQHIAEGQKPPFKRYAYVSLFGLNAMAELKAALFENAVPPDQAAKGATPATLRDEMQKVWEAGDTVGASRRLGRLTFWKGRKHAQTLTSFLPSWGTALRSATFLAIRDYVVCIDDVERKGAGLSMTEVLGLVSYLKEQRNCRVILILNESGFGADGEAEKDRFSGFREKVLDREVVFSPTPAECAGLVFTGKPAPYTWAAIHAGELGITNIRILQRVARVLDDFLPVLIDAREAVLRSFVHAATLLTWSFYGDAGGAPPYALVRNINVGHFLMLNDREKRTPDEQVWISMLSDYGFRMLDAMDTEICNYLERGYVDTHAAAGAMQEGNDRADAEKASGSLTEAWNLFHDTFADNTAEFTSSLIRTATANARWVRYYEAETIAHALRSLGKDADADDFVAAWIATNAVIDPARLVPPSEHFGIGRRDAPFRNAAAAVAESHEHTPLLDETIKGLVGRSGWNPEEIDVLAAASAEDYLAFFRSVGTDSKLNAYIRTVLRFGGIADSSSTYQKIALSVSIALRTLGGESPINAMRIDNFTLFDLMPALAPAAPANPFTAKVGL